MLLLIPALILAYLIGSLSSAIIVCKCMRLPDPRTEGSGNPGTTNVLRIGGKKAAIITLIGDVLKGFLPVLAAHLMGFTGLYLALILLAAFLGHLYPLFFGFKGGKGVATAMGGLFALSWPVALATVITWLVVAFIFRYSSLAALAAAILSPLYNIVIGDMQYEAMFLIVTLFILWRHRENITRLIAGTEKKIGAKKDREITQFQIIFIPIEF